MLDVNNVSKTFSGTSAALKNVELKVEEGEFVVLLGPSGSGKTTLLRAISGLVVPDHGAVYFRNKQILENLSAYRKTHLGFVFQDFNLVENLSVLNNVLCGLLSSNGILKSIFYLFDRKQKLEALNVLQRVGLISKCHVRVSQLSGGQKQRVGIARAIVKEPSLLLADEPVASLDPVTAISVLSLIQQASRELGITVICSLHQVDLALKYSDRIIGLDEGQVVFDAKTEETNREQIIRIYGQHAQGLISGSL